MHVETEGHSQEQKWTPGDRRAQNAANKHGIPSEKLRRAEDLFDAGGLEAFFSPTSDHTQRLRSQLLLLTETNTELEAFNATVSHDLCSPITAISGYCQVLREVCRDQLDERAQEYLESIYDATLQMKQLISSLLQFSSISRVALRREKIDLSRMAQEVADQLKLSAPKRGITFMIAPGITAEGDPGLCRSLLDNILGNAWKYSLGRKKPVIEFGTTQQSGRPVYFIRDNGPGFDMALAGQIFAPFQRIPGTDAEGHGIGLATVDRIVKRHGGRVWAESQPGRGATFFFTMG